MEWTYPKIVLVVGIVCFFGTLAFIPATQSYESTECRWWDDGECRLDGPHTVTEPNSQHGTFLGISTLLVILGALGWFVEVWKQVDLSSEDLP